MKKNYPSVFGYPVIGRVETSIFHIHYYSFCLSCGFCHDSCCSHGVDIDIDNVKRIMACSESLEKFIQSSSSEWFSDIFYDDKEYPGGRFTRTRIKDGACVFRNRNGRGCGIHKFCLSSQVDFHTLKPMVSSLFPVTFDEGLLHPSDEVLDESLVCLHEGLTLYRGVRAELNYYFGAEFIHELDSLEHGTPHSHPLDFEWRPTGT
ncbi:MAG: DUF3109 family protein [Deltaproteobacteria bacterium]|nr:DUF3109 family protein [Deltaproteobacteria bacterium]